MHHPPVEIVGVSDSFQYERREAVSELADVLTRHRQVIRLFCGHAHRPRTASVADVLASTVPSIAVDLRKGSYRGEMATLPVFQTHHYDGNGTFNSKNRRPEVS